MVCLEDKDKDTALTKVAIGFTQAGNTLGTTSDMEELTLEVESQYGDISKGGLFFVLRTNTGWSFDNINDIEQTIRKLWSKLKNIKI